MLVTASASEGLYSAISGLVHPGDEMGLEARGHPPHADIAAVGKICGNGAIKLTVPDFAVAGMRCVPRSPRTRMIIINTPHNPSGPGLLCQ